MKNSLVIVILLTVVIVGGFVLFGKNKTTNNNLNLPSAPPVDDVYNPPSQEPSANNQNNQPPAQTGGVIPETKTVVYSDSGFSPSSLTIKVGDTVTFVNQSLKSVWPASAMHPTHKVYPGSGIEKCGTSEESKIFDACRGIAPGASWSFKFGSAGSWGYHDHLDASKFGKIIVQ